MMTSLHSQIFQLLITLDLNQVRLKSICTNQLRMWRILSNGGLLTVTFIQNFIAWLWTISASLVNFWFYNHSSPCCLLPLCSYINCCWMCILTGSPTSVIYSQPSKCLIYLCLSLSRFLGLPQSHFFWGCTCSCEMRLQEKAGRYWYRCGGYWVNNL